MRQTKFLPVVSAPLIHGVFAGCRQSLLQDGPSRRYLRKSFPGCLVPYPGASPGALTRFFPGNIGLRRLRSGSAANNNPYSDFSTEGISGLQTVDNLQASGFARHPGRPYRSGSLDSLGSRGFYVRAYCGLLPPRTSDMLAVRIGQLTAWGLTPH
jgi:hypothetical protein